MPAHQLWHCGYIPKKVGRRATVWTLTRQSSTYNHSYSYKRTAERRRKWYFIALLIHIWNVFTSSYKRKFCFMNVLPSWRERKFLLQTFTAKTQKKIRVLPPNAERGSFVCTTPRKGNKQKKKYIEEQWNSERNLGHPKIHLQFAFFHLFDFFFFELTRYYWSFLPLDSATLCQWLKVGVVVSLVLHTSSISYLESIHLYAC